MISTIHSLLKMLASYTVSIALAERSFSAFERLKTGLQCNMLQEDSPDWRSFIVSEFNKLT